MHDAAGRRRGHGDVMPIEEGNGDRGEEIERRTEVFHRYEAAFGESPPLTHWNERFDLFALMEMAIARGRKLTAEELGGGHPEDSVV